MCRDHRKSFVECRLTGGFFVGTCVAFREFDLQRLQCTVANFEHLSQNYVYYPHTLKFSHISSRSVAEIGVPCDASKVLDISAIRKRKTAMLILVDV